MSRRESARARRTSWALVIVLAAGAVAGLAQRIRLLLDLQYPTYDGAIYLIMAQRIVDTGSIPYEVFPPGWPALAGGAAWLTGVDDPLARLQLAAALNLLFTLATCGVTVAIARRLGLPRSYAWAAATLVWTAPVWVRLAVSDLSEPSYTLMLSLGLLLLLQGRWLGAGIPFGLCYLVRPEILLVLFALPLLARVDPWRASAEPGVGAVAPPRLRWQSTLAGAAPALVAYVVFASLEAGRPVLSSKAGALWESWRATSDPSSFFARATSRGWELIERGCAAMGCPLLLGGVAGAIVGRSWMAVVLLPPFLLPLLPYRVEHRFWAPAIPGLAVLAMLAVGVLSSRLRPRSPVFGTGAVLVLTVLTLAFQLPALSRTRVNEEMYPSMRIAGEWLADNAPADAKVAGRKPYVAFWAEREFRRPPSGADTGTLAEWARREGVNHLAVNDGEVREMEPGLAPLAGPRPAPETEAYALLGRFGIEGHPLFFTNLYRILDVPSTSEERTSPERP